VGVIEIPGSGGVTRGRGDAELGFTGETEGRTDQFEAKELPQAEVLDPESTAVVSIGLGTPETEANGQSGGNVDAGTSVGRGAWKRRLAPHHREAVQEFFGKPGEKR
jgi:hypothetical protein